MTREPQDAPGAPATAAVVILAIEDETPILRFLKAALEGHGYRFLEARTAADGVREASMRNPDLVLLDLGLPDGDGLDVTRRLREWSTVPIIVLSARGQERDKVAALDAGADDYLTKPFAIGELMARIRVALRHAARPTGGEADPVVRIGPLTVDRLKRRVHVRDVEVRLTPREYRLLAALTAHPGRVFTHEQLLREVWGPGHSQQHHYLRVYMAQLRQKLEREPSQPELLITEPGVGYRLRDQDGPHVSSGDGR